MSLDQLIDLLLNKIMEDQDEMMLWDKLDIHMNLFQIQLKIFQLMDKDLLFH